MTTILKLVDTRTGEIVEAELAGVIGELRDARQELARLEDIIAGLQRDIRGWTVRYRELERDRAAEAREHELWPVGKRIFAEWRRTCRHPRSPWTPDRFWQIEPFLTNSKYGKTLDDRIVMCRRAVAGAAHDAFETKRRNGTVKHHNDWDLIHRTSDKWEEFCCKAPLGWTP